MPLPAFSAVVTAAGISHTGVLTVQDSIAGLGLEADLKGFPGSQVDLVVVPPSQKFVVFPLALDSDGNAHMHVPGSSIHEAGTYSAFVGLQGKRLLEDVTFNVLPDSVDPASSTLAVSRNSIAADGRDAAGVTVTLQDQYGNALAKRPVKLIASSAQVRLDVETQETDADGVARFSVSASTPGTYSLRALDLLSNNLLTAEASLKAGSTKAVGGPVSPYRAQLTDTAYPTPQTHDVIQGFEVRLGQQALKIDEMTDLTIRAVDAQGRTVEDYGGTVQVTAPTDSTATLPGLSAVDGAGSVRFEGRNRGIRTIPLSVSFRRIGRHTLSVDDTTDPTHVLHGEVTVTVTQTGNPDVLNLRIDSPAQNSTVGGATVLLEGSTQPFTNIFVSGGVDKSAGESDEAGRFSIPVQLDENQGEYTFHITDDAGGDISLHLVRDADPPIIEDPSVAPDTPEEGASTLLVAHSEPGLASLGLQIGAERMQLQEDGTRPGTYQLLFTAPRAGSYQPVLTARDPAGNITNLSMTLTVLAKKLPTVQHLRATPQKAAVSLSWDPVTNEPVDHYKIYVAEGPDMGTYAYSLETDDASRTGAVVTGLKTGAPYAFAVTAVADERESDKSEPVLARTLGLLLTVDPQPEALAAEWSFPVATSVQSFLLEYGAHEELTEQRTIPGGDIKANEKRSLMLRDLLPGVEYFIKLTPIATTGEPLEDLVATGNGTPLNSDGHFAAPDQLPPLSTIHPVAPTATQPGSGIPPPALWGIIAAAVLLILWQAKRMGRRQAERKFFRTMEARYHR